MVLLTTTPQILDLISSLPASSLTSLKKATAEPLPVDISSPVSHKTLITLSHLLRNGAHESDASPHSSQIAAPKPTRHQSYSLNALLRSTKVYVPPARAKPEPSPEYVALMTRLRAEAERKQYQTLLSQQSDELLGVIDRRHDSDDIHSRASGPLGQHEGDQDDDPITPSLVINIFLSVVLSAVAVFMVSRWWSNPAMRVLLALAAGIVVGVAEVVVYAAYVRNVRKSKAKERNKRERKVLLGKYTGDLGEDVYDGTGAKIVVDHDSATATTVGGSGESNDSSVLVEQNVIWGRGKHGGMRRRVRERWEKDQNQQHDDAVSHRSKN